MEHTTTGRTVATAKDLQIQYTVVVSGEERTRDATENAARSIAGPQQRCWLCLRPFSKDTPSRLQLMAPYGHSFAYIIAANLRFILILLHP